MSNYSFLFAVLGCLSLATVPKTECVFFVNPGTVAGVCTLAIALKDGFNLMRGTVSKEVNHLCDKPVEQRTLYDKAAGKASDIINDVKDTVNQHKQAAFHQPSVQFTGNLKCDYLISLVAMALVGSLLIYYANLPVNNLQ